MVLGFFCFVFVLFVCFCFCFCFWQGEWGLCICFRCPRLFRYGFRFLCFVLVFVLVPFGVVFLCCVVVVVVVCGDCCCCCCYCFVGVS